MRLLLKRIFSLIPFPVPTGMTAYDKYVADIVELVGPIATPGDIEWVVNAEMMRIEPPRQNRLPKNYIQKNFFVSSIKLAAAKQLAGARFQALKEKQQAAQAAQLAEATAQTPVVADEVPKA